MSIGGGLALSKLGVSLLFFPDMGQVRMNQDGLGLTRSSGLSFVANSKTIFLGLSSTKSYHVE